MKMNACKTWIMAVLCSMGLALALPVPENPATGIWIQQKGEIAIQDPTNATLYYTKYAAYEKDAVKSVKYEYDGAGFLRLVTKDTLCGKDDGMQGADGIVHHPDGSLIVAAQGNNVHKISKTAKADGHKNQCVVKTVPINDRQDNGVWHLMMDPNEKWVWAAGIPGRLRRISVEDNAENLNFGPSYYVKLNPGEKIRKKVEKRLVDGNKLATVIWDLDGHAFFTYSDYFGGGCESPYVRGGKCSSAEHDQNRAKAFFGYFTDTTWVTVTAKNRGEIGGTIGDSVITELNTELLIDSLEGAHGGTYDPYSKTIFVFGGSKIIQIQPQIKNGKMSASVVGEIDMREFFFNESEQNLTGPRTNDGGLIGWRLDQGTVDGLGHLFVASNTGHLVFVDYAANVQKRITDNVLVHLQWIDNYLDDLAPLSGVGVKRKGANHGEEEMESSSSGISSALVEFSSSSEKPRSSSTGKSSGGTGKSSSSTKYSSGGHNSSGNNGSSSSVKRSSSSMVVYSEGRSSSSKKSSSSGTGGNSSGNTPNTSGSQGGSSGNVNSSGGSGNSSGGTGNSSGNTGKSSGSVNSSNSQGGRSSSSKNDGSGIDIAGGSSSSNRYAGFTDFDLSSTSNLDFYPSQDKFDDGDSIIASTTVLIPVDSVKGAKGTTTVGGNTYLTENNPTGQELDLRYNSNIDSAQVGQVIAIKLDSAKVAEVFGSTPDSLTFATNSGLILIDPKNPEPTDTMNVKTDGDVVIWVSAEEAIRGGTIVVADPNGRVVVIDNINFYDPIPDADKGFIKDSDGDETLDYVEIVLKDTLAEGLSVYSVSLVVSGDTLNAAAVPNLGYTEVAVNAYENKRVNTIALDVSDLKFPEEFPKDAYAIITYTNTDEVHYTRTVPISEIGSQVIKAAQAIRNVHGKDSLFVEFNIDLIPADLSEPEMLVMIKQNSKRFGFVGQISNVYMPTKNIVILVGDSLGLKGGMKDSVSLFPSVTFHNLPYLTSDEYEREVPIKVTERLPSVKDVEYWDVDGDGVLDKIVTNFQNKLTPSDVDMLHMTYPWYSDRGFLIQMQASPENLALSKDSMSVSWNVFSTVQFASGVTSLSEDLPPAMVYTYYPVLGEIFVNEEPAPLVDKMAPVISAATLSYGSKADTLTVFFSETILYNDLEGRDYFSYIHGKETIDLLPTRIDWAQDGKSAKLILDASMATILPGDSLMIVKGEKDNIVDNFGNIAGENPSPVIIAGLLNHLVETTKMGTFDANDNRVVSDEGSENYTLQTVSSVNLRYMPGSTTKEDMEKEGALGHLVQLGERFVPQLLDHAQISADGTVDPSVLDSLDPAKVYITFVVNYYDHLGQYVNDTTIMVPCNSPKFGGNCLSSDQKVFVNWNFKDHTGRFVGSGVYSVQFKMVVRYEKKKIEEEIKDKWGVRRKKHKK